MAMKTPWRAMSLVAPVLTFFDAHAGDAAGSPSTSSRVLSHRGSMTLPARHLLEELVDA
jgi:hypothetical protein